MERIDILGYRPDRHKVFTKELLSQTDDKVLHNIVKKAAEELNSPMAMINIVLDHIQLFKSSFGLPATLEAAGGTHRDVSFCQYVVKNDQYFKVSDAKHNKKVPQQLVAEYGISSYLGVPIYIDEVVIGSLCVLDTKSREFTKNDIKVLEKLAKLVNRRLKSITEKRNQNRLEITESALLPGIRELIETLKPIQDSIYKGYANASAVSSYMNCSKYLLFNNHLFDETPRLNFEAAQEANSQNIDMLANIEMALADVTDCVNALKNLTLNTAYSHLSEIIISAQDLSRNSTKAVGGFGIPDFPSDPLIYTKNNIAVAIVTNCILAITNELINRNAKDGILIQIVSGDSNNMLIQMSSQNLDAVAYQKIHDSLTILLNSEPHVSLNADEKGICLSFNIVV